MNARVNHKCVYRLMKLLGLRAVIRRKRHTYKPHKATHVAENMLNREFQKEYKPMDVLLTDVTEFKYGQHSKAYLSAILDYGSNKIVAFKLSKHNNNALVRDTVRQIEDDLVPTHTPAQRSRLSIYVSRIPQFCQKTSTHPQYVACGQVY